MGKKQFRKTKRKALEKKLLERLMVKNGFKQIQLEDLLNNVGKKKNKISKKK